MCGIFGAISRSPVDLARARLGLKALSHRGPDGRNVWVADDQRTVLGHHRLSIVGGETGSQPISNERGDVAVVVNGEFYAHRQIRADLEGRGHVFKTMSDSEILVHLYEEYGLRCVEHLRGEFAFLLWDAKKRTLVAGRDRFGIKPLVYARTREGCVAASEAKALWAYGIAARWDREQVFQRLHIECDGDATLFDGISQVPPGHMLIAIDGETRLLRYWNPPLIESDQSPTDEVAAAEMVRELLIDAVRIRLAPDTATATYLSGGLDSSIVTSIAARHSQTPLNAYVVSFGSADFDEASAATSVARQLGVRPQVVDLDDVKLADHFEATVVQCEQVVANGNAVAKFLLSQYAAAQGTRVVLTGEGADEIFAGYPSFVADCPDGLSDGRASSFSRRDQTFVAASAGMDTSGVREILGYVPAWIGAAASKAHLLRPVLAPALVAEFRDRDPFKVLVQRVPVPARVDPSDRLAVSMHMWRQTRLPNVILSSLGDRAEMAHGLEGRLPFLDHVLAAQVLRLPSALKVKGGVEKYILRSAFRDLVPAEVVHRRKGPFIAPPPPASLTSAIKEVLASADNRCVDIIAKDAALRLLRDAEASNRPATRDLLWRCCYTIASLFILEAAYGLS